MDRVDDIEILLKYVQAEFYTLPWDAPPGTCDASDVGPTGLDHLQCDVLAAMADLNAILNLFRENE